MPSRLINLADVVEVFDRAGGIEAAVTIACERRGGQFDPEVVDAFCDNAADLLEESESGAGWESVIGAEPTSGTRVEGEALDAALAAIGEFSELKSPWFMGHAQHVAEPAAEAGKALGLRPDDVVAVRHCAFVQDLGRLGIPNTIWDKPGMLTRQELERVRIHPYLSERMLSFSPPLAPLGDVAVQHHERLDGSGYPRRLSGEAVSPMARILAAADVYAAVTAPRPQRAAMSTADAASELMREVTGGRLDGDAARAVLRAAGQQVGQAVGVAGVTHLPRDRNPAVAGPRHVQQGDRRCAGHLPEDGGDTYRAHLWQDPCVQSRPGQCVRIEARADVRPAGPALNRKDQVNA